VHRRTLLIVVGCLAVLVAVVPGGGFAGSQANDATIANGALPLEAGPGQAIYGETELRAGTTVTVRTTLFPDDTPFTHERTATVSRDGEFHTVVDLSAVPPETPAEVSVLAGDTVLATETTTVRQCRVACSRNDTARSDTDVAFTAGERLTLEAGPGGVVRGETSLPPGTTLAVLLGTTGAAEQSRHARATTTVTADGRFRAVLDLSGIDVPDPVEGTVELVAVNGSESLAERPVTLTECTAACDPPDADSDAATPQFAGRVTEAALTEVAYGETVLLPIDLHDADEGRIRIGGTEDDFNATLRVADGTGNERVTVVFNTQPAGGSVLFAAEPGDTVAIEHISGVLRPEDILEVTLDANRSAAEVADRARLRIAEPTDCGAELPDASGDSREPETSAGTPWLEIVLLAAATVCAAAGIALLAGLFDR